MSGPPAHTHTGAVGELKKFPKLRISELSIWGGNFTNLKPRSALYRAGPSCLVLSCLCHQSDYLCLLRGRKTNTLQRL